MANIVSKDGKFSLTFSEKEFSELGLDPKREYEVSKAKHGVYVLLDKGEAKSDVSKESDEHIFSLIMEKSLSQRVVGTFEKFLNKEELKKLNELLNEGKIEKFKLSEKYKKPVYQIVESKASLQADNSNAPLFEKDGFAIIKEDNSAREFSEKNYMRIKKGEILGIKSFDNGTYVIKSDKFNLCEKQLTDYLKKRKKAGLNDIAKELSMQKELAKIVCEFLKESGDLVEKKAEEYSYIE